MTPPFPLELSDPLSVGMSMQGEEGFRGGVLPRLSRPLYLQSPPNARRRLRISDPRMPKDLRLLHILDGFGG